MKTCRNLIVILALVAYPILFWIWKSHGFPIDVNACQHTGANGQCDYYAPEHVYLFFFQKIGEAASDNNFVTAMATVFLAFITGGLVFVGYRQIQTSRAQLRAYIVVAPTGVSRVRNGWATALEIINTGQTPARDVRILARAAVLLHPPPVGFDFNDIEQPDESQSSFTLGAGQKSASEATLEDGDYLPEEAAEFGVKNGWLGHYVYGTVSYIDIFGTRQWTNFCTYNQWDGTTVTGITSDRHNDAS